MNNANLDALAAAISKGKSYHVFARENGSYITSFYFPQSAQNCLQTVRFPAVVKYLTNQSA